MKSPKLIIKKTKKYGNGVFAGDYIKKRVFIHTFGGETVQAMDLVNRINSEKENIDDPLQVGKRTYIDLDPFSRSFNHSCDPNSGVRGRGELFALKDIEPGDEITFDYSTTIAPTKWEMRCSCGSKKCRKILGDVLSISKNQTRYYLKAGAFQRYMKSILKDVEQGKYKIPKYEILALEKLNKTSN